LAQRSRKRGQREQHASGLPAAPAAGDEAAHAFGERTEGRGGEAAGSATTAPSRSEQRAAEIRAGLEPLAAGERPGAVTVAAVVAVVLAILVVVGELKGARIGKRGTLPGALLLAGILLVAAYGMWRARYWAVLGFEALLAFQIVVAALALTVASNLLAVVLCVAVIGLGGWLFWKLVRAMARIQMPERRPAP
jgi:hypothetical protein